MQGIRVQNEAEIQIDLDISSYIPETYIEDEKQKIEIYQDIALCRKEKQIEDVIDEIIDRFGTMPKEVENLIEVAKIKILARNVNILKVVQRQKAVMFFIEQGTFKEELIEKLLKIYGTNLRFSPGATSYITLKVEDISDKELINKIKEFLKNLE